MRCSSFQNEVRQRNLKGSDLRLHSELDRSLLWLENPRCDQEIVQHRTALVRCTTLGTDQSIVLPATALES